MDRRLRAKAVEYISAREKEQRKIPDGSWLYEEGMRVGTAEEIPWTG